MLTRKAFQLIADVVRETRGECEARRIDPLAMDVLTGKLCLVLKRENAAFNADRFRDACALREGGARIGSQATPIGGRAPEAP